MLKTRPPSEFGVGGPQLGFKEKSDEGDASGNFFFSFHDLVLLLERKEYKESSLSSLRPPTQTHVAKGRLPELIPPTRLYRKNCAHRQFALQTVLPASLRWHHFAVIRFRTTARSCPR
jgi:hypothetical protein